MKKKSVKYLNTARYGRKVRLAYNKVKKQQTAKYECPKCGKTKVKRISFALWQCTSCKAVFSGGAYKLSTPEGETVRRMLSNIKEEY